MQEFSNEDFFLNLIFRRKGKVKISLLFKRWFEMPKQGNVLTWRWTFLFLKSRNEFFCFSLPSLRLCFTVVTWIVETFPPPHFLQEDHLQSLWTDNRKYLISFLPILWKSQNGKSDNPILRKNFKISYLDLKHK